MSEAMAIARRRAYELPCELLRPAGLVVRREVGHREEEGRPAPGAAADELRRLAGQHVGLVVARQLTEHAPVCVPLVVLEDVVAPHAVRRVVHEPVPLGPAVRLVRRPLASVAVQELADVHGHVAGPLEPHRQVLALVQPAVAPATPRIEAEHPVVVGVLPGEERRPRWAADGIRGEGARERDTRGSDQPPRLRKRGHVVEALVVGHHDHHVRPACSGARVRILSRCAARWKEHRCGGHQQGGAPHPPGLRKIATEPR